MLSFFPLLYFFTFLYYTDPGSTFFVLLMYLYHLHDNTLISCLMGIVAIFFRQTNIIWVAFMAGLQARKVIFQLMDENEADDRINTENDYQVISFVLKIVVSPSRLFGLVFHVLREAFWYIAVMIGFAIFVFINGGIVVGDKSHHEACMNIPQLFYFTSVTLVFSYMHLVSPDKVINFLKFIISKWYICIIFAAFAYLAIWKYTHVHIYLLSDNRHYTFYVWSKLYARHEYIRYILIPMYLYAAWSIYRNVSHMDVLWRLVFIVCLIAATVPQKLLEFRYFIIPYLILRLHFKSVSNVNLFIEMLFYVLINSFTIYMYTMRPLRWHNTDELQRFMW